MHCNHLKLITESNNKHTDTGLMGLCVYEAKFKKQIRILLLFAKFKMYIPTWRINIKHPLVYQLYLGYWWLF